MGKAPIPGVKVPLLKTAEQRLIAWTVLIPKIWKMKPFKLKDCALASIGATGTIGITTASPAAAFDAAFLICFAAKFGDIVTKSASTETRTKCKW